MGALAGLSRQVGLLAWALIACFHVRPALGQCEYEVVAEIKAPSCGIGGSPVTIATSMNASGVVVGWYRQCIDSGYEAFMWTAEGGFVTLPHPPGIPSVRANDINDAGVIVVSTESPTRGYVYDHGVWTELPPVEGSQGWSEAFAINNANQVAGYRSIEEGLNPYSAFVWTAEGGFTDLGLRSVHSSATGISESGTVVGWSGRLTVDSRAFRWSEGRLDFFPVDDESNAAWAVSDAEEAVGYLGFDSGTMRGFVWGGATYTELAPPPGYDTASARSINSRGVIVGTCNIYRKGSSSQAAAIWYGASAYDLNDLTTGQGAHHLRRPLFIGGDGHILVQRSSGSITLLLVPNNVSRADLTGDCRVGVDDLSILLSKWLQPFAPGDLDGDGLIEVDDLVILLLEWNAGA